MTTLSAPDQPVGALSVAQFDSLVTEIVRRVLREETHATAAPAENGSAIPQELLATFGAWEDERPTDEIVAEIYSSRTRSTSEVDL